MVMNMVNVALSKFERQRLGDGLLIFRDQNDPLNAYSDCNFLVSKVNFT